MPRKKKTIETPKTEKPAFHEGLDGFDIKVNSFGQIKTNFEIDKLNAFLNKELKSKAEAEAKAEESDGINSKAKAEAEAKAEESEGSKSEG